MFTWRRAAPWGVGFGMGLGGFAHPEAPMGFGMRFGMRFGMAPIRTGDLLPSKSCVSPEGTLGEGEKEGWEP